MTTNEKLEKIIDLLEQEDESAGILKFKLPEDTCGFKTASNAMSWALVSKNLERYFRGLLKYGEHKLDTNTIEIVEEKFFGLMDKYGVSTDDIE